MPKKNVTSKAACKAPSPAEETHPETSLGAMDVAKLMAVITNSEQRVLARIDTMDKKVDSKSHELHKKIDSLSADLKGQIDAVRVDLMAKIESVSSTCVAQYTRITSLEDATNAYSDRVVDLQSQVLQLKEEVTQA